MFLSRMVQKYDYWAYIGIGQICLGIGGLSLILGTSRILGTLISQPFWLDFLKGLFTGLSFSIFILSVFLSIKGLKDSKQTLDHSGRAING